jgi:hypothetical protein
VHVYPSSDRILTLLNAVLLGTLVVLILLLAGDTLDALVEVVLVGSALGGVGALCTGMSQ